MIRIRAVQDLSPAEAVGFVFDLKPIVRKILGPEPAPAAKDEIDLEEKIDRLALAAFDVYMKCREQMWSIRAREIRHQSLGILERMQAWRERRAEESENTPGSGRCVSRSLEGTERKEGSTAWERCYL